MHRILTSIVLVMMMMGCDSENASDAEKPAEAEKSPEAPKPSEAEIPPQAAKTLDVEKVFEEGAAAFNRADYPTALYLWRPLAERGLAPAQINLGNIYLHGNGVVPNDAEAAKWFALAAEQGDVKAQNNLGVMYANGKGVPQDIVQAYKWFSIGASKSAASDQPKDRIEAAQNRDLAASQMTPEQIADGQKLAGEWKPK